MFQALKSIALSLALSVPVSAQWGAVTSQPDTNRFINSQQDFGLIMPHQQVIVGMLDTTITSAGIGGGNAYKVIVGSLLDYEDNCANYSITNGVASCEGSYERWRELEKSTSWYQADRGDTTAMFPTNYAVTVSTGKDSISIWNRDTAELWMEFHERAGNVHSAICYTGNRLRNVAFKDGILYAPCDGVKLAIVDFLSDDVIAWGTSGQSELGLDIQTRNSQGTLATLNGDPDLAADEVEWVSVVRDPFGLKDDLGRPDHWWMVNAPSNGAGSLYNPRTHTILDQASTTGDFNNVSVSDRGQIWMTYNNSGADDNLSMIGNTGNNNTIFGQTADGWLPQLNYSGIASGAQDLAWTSGINGTKILASDNRNSIVGDNADNAYAWCDEGVYIISPTGGFGVSHKQSASAKQRFSATVNAPYEFGESGIALALEDNTTDSSPLNNTFSASGMGTISAVFGDGASWRVGGYISKTGVTNWHIDVGEGFTFMLWLKHSLYTSAEQAFVVFSGSAEADYLKFYGETDGTVKVTFSESDNLDVIDVSTVVADDEWHHYAMTRDYQALKYHLYIDGVLVGSTTITNTLPAMEWQEFYLGRDEFNANGIKGRAVMDDLSYGVSKVYDGKPASAETIARIYAEGRKKLAMGTPVFAGDRDTGVLSDAFYSNNVVDIDALDNGMWAVAFSDANTVQVFDGRIPIQQIAAPAPTTTAAKSIALIQSPGADSVGVVIGTTQNLKIVQPSVNLRAAMARQYKEPIHVGDRAVADSSWIDGVFATPSDAMYAAYNAGGGYVFVLNGTYGPFDMDKGQMTVECDAPKSAISEKGVLFNGTLGTDDHAVSMSVRGRLINCGVYTKPDGGGGGKNAIDISGGAYGHVIRNICVDSDADCVDVGQSQWHVTGNTFLGADEWNVHLEAAGDWAFVQGNWTTLYGITANTGTINCTVVGNTGSGSIIFDSGSSGSSVTGNANSGAITDNGSNTFGNN